MSTKLNGLIAAWRSINLSETQDSLDETASQIASKQDECELSRKKLVELLKEFKSTASEECRATSGKIIKSFQAEVDTLNKRCKFSESAFLKCYQKFLEIVDPIPSLEHCLSVQKKAERVDDQQIEIDSLRTTIDEYKDEFKNVRSQEITIKNLKEKVKSLNEEMENMRTEKTSEIEKKLQEQYSQKEISILEEHSRVVKKLEETETKHKILEQNLEQVQSELFDSKTNQDNSTFAKTETMEILVNDVDRLTQQNLTLQKRVSELQELSCADEATHKSTELNMSQVEIASLESELKAKNREIEQLITDMNRVQTKLVQIEDQGKSTISGLQKDLSESREALEELKQQMAHQHDYDEIKKELAIIKSVEFSSKSMDPETMGEKTLEGLVLEKNRLLQNENTKLKLEATSFADKVQNLEAIVHQLTDQNNKKTILIGQLESDMFRIQDSQKAVDEDQSSQLTVLSTAISNIEPHADNRGQVGTQASESVLSIVLAQRERFRVHNEELEAEISTKNNRILAVEEEVDSLRNDNLKLYEKIKFLQSFDGRAVTSEAATEQRYRSQYESSLDPFSSFSHKERQRKYASLSPFEKMTLSFGRLILQSKGARTAAFLYLVLVHCLIFFVLFVVANTESCRRQVSSNCAQMFKEHMHDVHGNSDFDVT